MTIQDVLVKIEELKPNQYSESIKLQWLSEIEKKVYNETFSKRQGFEQFNTNTYDESTDYNTKLNIPDEYSMTYVYYVMAMIDYANGETERYNNDMQMFNSAYDELRTNWYSTHRQLAKGNFRK